jgi:hypothetical protein
MTTPRMDTFKLPLSPSHVATTAGIALTQTAAGLRPEAKGIITAAIVGTYIIGEAIYSSIRGKKVEVPDAVAQEVVDLRERVTRLGA